MRRIALIGAILLAAAGMANLRAQTVLGDPRDAAKIFSSNCSACHKSPQGLAKSGQVAGFLRQHYTTGPEMSAAMAAYLVAAGSAPAGKKGQATAAATPGAEGPAAKSKGKKHEQTSGVPPAAEGVHARTLRGKQREAKAHEERPRATPVEPAAPPVAPPAVQATPPAPAAEERPGAPVAVTASANPPAASAAAPAPVAPTASPERPPLVVLDIPLPTLPDGPPAELSQSAFSSSPVP